MAKRDILSRCPDSPPLSRSTPSDGRQICIILSYSKLWRRRRIMFLIVKLYDVFFLEEEGGGGRRRKEEEEERRRIFSKIQYGVI